MSAQQSAPGKPGPESVQAVARAVGLKAPGGMLTWTVLSDLAFDAYWNARTVPVKRGRVPWWNFPHRRPGLAA